MTPSKEAADASNVNRKTVLEYYRLLRLAIAEANRNERSKTTAWTNSAGGARQQTTVEEEHRELLEITIDQGEVQVAVPPKGRGEGGEVGGRAVLMIYGRNNGRGVIVEEMEAQLLCARMSALETSVSDLERFWQFSRDRLKRYRRRFGDDLLLYMEEMIFRFRHRDESEALKYLVKIFKSGFYCPINNPNLLEERKQ